MDRTLRSGANYTESFTSCLLISRWVSSKSCSVKKTFLRSLKRYFGRHGGIYTNDLFFVLDECCDLWPLPNGNMKTISVSQQLSRPRLISSASHAHTLHCLSYLDCGSYRWPGAQITPTTSVTVTTSIILIILSHIIKKPTTFHGSSRTNVLLFLLIIFNGAEVSGPNRMFCCSFPTEPFNIEHPASCESHSEETYTDIKSAVTQSSGSSVFVLGNCATASVWIWRDSPRPRLVFCQIVLQEQRLNIECASRSATCRL